MIVSKWQPYNSDDTQGGPEVQHVEIRRACSASGQCGRDGMGKNLAISPMTRIVRGMAKKDTIGTAEAAEILGMHQDYVKRLAKRGKIPAVRIGKTWVFDRRDVEKYTPAPVGRPKTPAKRRSK